jgi:hypothetical protein
MARKATRNGAEPGAPEEHESRGDSGVTKTQAARAAIEAGYEKPTEAVGYIKDRFGIDMNPQYFSSIKSQMKKKDGGARQGGKKPKTSAEGYLAPPPKTAPTGGSELLDAMEAMKPLVACLGKEQVKRIVDLLG